jgi:hypothetical protein
MAISKRIIAALLLTALTATGCATTQPSGQIVTVTKVQTKEEHCDEQAYQQASGWRIATWSTLPLGLIVWPSLVVPAVTGIVSVIKEPNARVECMEAPAPQQDAPVAATPAVGMKSPTPPPVPTIENAKPAPAIVPLRRA